MRIYLAGRIDGATDSECKGWRDAIKSYRQFVYLDPMDRDYRGIESANVAAIVEQDKRDIESSDLLLVYFDRPSVGTSMEVFYARSLGKPVLVINASWAVLSPWLQYHATRVAQSIDEAIEVLSCL
jgi:nucleoside 2-deoxyribosyltransferase